MMAPWLAYCYSRASLRFQAMDESKAKEILSDEEGEPNFKNLLDNEVLKLKGVNAEELDEAIYDQLIKAEVGQGAARAFASGSFPTYLRSHRKDANLEPYYIPRDTKILDYSRQWLFNDIVNYFRAAGFAGGYLFVDDIENLVDQMARRERIEFAKEFALCTVRPGYANTAHNFFSCVLTTHQQASVSLSQAWGEAGLSAIGRLDPSSDRSIELPLPNKDQAREIIVAHLDHYRINLADKGTIRPFTQGGLDALLKNRQLLHPRHLLTAAASVRQYAVAKKLTQVDAADVSAALEGAAATPTTPDVTEGIDGAV
jgi:hypothetical protein